MDNSDVYINSIIVGSVTAAVFFLGGMGVNKLGKKTLVGEILKARFNFIDRQKRTFIFGYKK